MKEWRPLQFLHILHNLIKKVIFEERTKLRSLTFPRTKRKREILTNAKCSQIDSMWWVQANTLRISVNWECTRYPVPQHPWWCLLPASPSVPVVDPAGWPWTVWVYPAGVPGVAAEASGQPAAAVCRLLSPAGDAVQPVPGVSVQDLRKNKKCCEHYKCEAAFLKSCFEKIMMFIG